MANPAYTSNFYKTFSGTDSIAFIIFPKCMPIAIGSVTTISYSMFRTKKPVINIGRTSINGVTRGSRIYGGTMIFTIVNQHWLNNLAEELPWIGEISGLKCDELPIFDILVASANEYGSYISMYISGVDFTDEQQTLSIEDMFTENVFQFIARDLSVFKAGKVLETDKSQDKISSTMTKHASGYLVTDSSVATDEEIYRGFDEYVRKRSEAKNKALTMPKRLVRDLYYSEVS